MSSEKKLSDLNFFICSTYEDLKPYRDAVIKKIRSEAGLINAQEFFGSRDQKPLETCLEEVGKSQVFIMFLANRYGSTVSETKKSYVQMEYEKAKDLKLLKLAYFMDENHPYPFKFVSIGEDGQALKDFKAQLRHEMTIDEFTTPEDLASKVLQDLLRELPPHGFSIGKPSEDETRVSVIELIKSFLALPKRFYSREFDMDVVLGSYERAPKDECEAFSMRYGSTLKRQFDAVNSEISSALGSDLNTLYAENSVAEELIRYKHKSKVLVKVRTVQGESTWQEPIYKYEAIEEPDYSYRPSSYLLSGSIRLDQDPFAPRTKIRKEKVIGHYEKHETLMCGLQLVGIKGAQESHNTVAQSKPK